MTLTRGAIIALLAALAIVAGGAMVSPAFAQPVPTKSDIQSERDSAKADRAYAAGRLDKARERRGLAEQARKNARDARNAADRNGWNRRAREHDGRADALEEEAAGLIAEAERKEAKAGRLQERLNAATQVDERRRAAAVAEERRLRETEEREAERRRDAADKMSRDEVLGVWRDSGDQAPFVIVQEEPGSQIHGYRLELHTLNRVWKGTYTPFEEGDIRREQDARVVFKVKPEAEEINPEVPLWARRAVAGKLEWKIELEESGSCGAPKMRGRWYPGEISWHEGAEGGAGGKVGKSGNRGEGGAKKAWISGEGEPIEFELAPSEDLHFDIVSKLKIQFRLPGQDDPDGTDIESVIKGQTFFIEVLVPKEMAEKLGAWAEVKIRGLTGGDTYALKVEAQPSGDRPVVLYTHIREFAFGDAIDIFLQGRYDAPPQSLNQGSVLAFDVINGEVVEFALGDARRPLRVFDNATLAGIVRYQEALAQLRVIYAAAVSDDSVPKAGRRAAQRRLLMVRNAQALVGLDDKLTPPQRLAIGEAYVGESGTGGMLHAKLGPSFGYAIDLIGIEPTTRRFAWYDERTPDWKRRYKLSDHVVWTSNYESFAVKKAAQGAKPDKGKLIADQLAVLSKAMYVIAVTLTCADGVWIALTGTDIFGKPVDAMDEAAGVAGSLLCFGPGMLRLLDDARTMSAGMRGGRGFRLGKSLPPQRVVVKEASGPMPSSLSPAKLEAMGLGPRPGAAGSPGFGPVSCTRPTISPALAKGTPPPGSLRPVPAAPGSTAHLGPQARIEYRYGDLSRHRQVMPSSCQVQSQNFLREQAGKGFRSEGQSMKDLRDFGVYVPYSRTQRQRWVGGLNDAQARDAAILSGGTAAAPRSLSLEQMAAARANGWEVKNVLHLNKNRPNAPPALHAVGLVQLERGANNRITRVHFFDPEVGYVVSLPACEYKNLLSATAWPNSQGFRWNRPPGGRTAARPTVGPSRPGPSGTRPPGATPGVPGPKGRPSQIPGQNRTIDEALKEHYQGKKYDPLHVTSFEAYQEIRQARLLEYPAKGGANFSIGGNIGSVRQGNTAIRINPKYAKSHIEWVKEPEGLIARNYIKGKDAKGNWIGEPVTYIPTENLQVFDPGAGPGQGGWKNIPQPPKKK